MTQIRSDWISVGTRRPCGYHGAMRWLVPLAIAGAGCASAGKGNSIIGGLTDAGLDGRGSSTNNFPEPDAALIDAPPQQITLAQGADTITRDNSIVCFNDRTGNTLANTYVRVFSLDDFSVTSPLHVTQVDFGIELADAGPGALMQPAQVTIGSYGDTPGTTLDVAQLTAIQRADIMIADGSGTRMTVPITADLRPGARLVVELALPDGDDAGSSFVIGSNTEGQKQPGYLSAPDCELNSPTAIDTLTAREVDVVMSVTGTTP